MKSLFHCKIIASQNSPIELKADVRSATSKRIEYWSIHQIEYTKFSEQNVVILKINTSFVQSVEYGYVETKVITL